MSATAAFLLGTAAGADVHVPGDPHVSGLHARVWRTLDGAVWVQDLGSMNGTWVAHECRPGAVRSRVYGPHQIHPGDHLWLGTRTRIRWLSGVAVLEHCDFPFALATERKTRATTTTEGA